MQSAILRTINNLPRNRFYNHEEILNKVKWSHNKCLFSFMNFWKKNPEEPMFKMKNNQQHFEESNHPLQVQKTYSCVTTESVNQQ